MFQCPLFVPPEKIGSICTPLGFLVITVKDLKCLAIVFHPLTGIHVRNSVDIPVFAMYVLGGAWVLMFLKALSREKEFIH